MQFFIPWIVMISKEIVRFHNFHIVNLRCLQNFSRAFCTGNVRACAHLTPFPKCARNPNLCPDPNDQRDADVKQPMRSKTETEWIHIEFNLTCGGHLSRYWLEQIRRETAAFVHSEVDRSS